MAKMSKEKQKAVKKSSVSTKANTKKINPLEKLKVEIATELGLMDKVKDVGWGGLTAAESGRIGGIMTRKLKAEGKLNSKPELKVNAK